MNILVLHSSLGGDASATRELTESFVQRELEARPDASAVVRDLAADPVPHLPAEMVPVQLGLVDAREATTGLADELIAELEQADLVLIGAPMYNFTVPSSLKAWIDHVVRARRTFAYVDGVPKGLLPEGKRAIVFTASGGLYSEGPATSMDHLVPYLRTVLGFIGLTEVEVVRAELQAVPDAAGPARERARTAALGLAA